MLYKKNSGFTIVELIVTIAIVTVLASISILNYGTFIDKLSLSSAGQEIAIGIRQAQTYGINVRESGAGSGSFSSSYGIYFNPTDDPTDFIIFVDNLPANGKYDDGSGCGSGSTECVEKMIIRNGATISDICKDVSTSPTCSTSSGARALHITFQRPSPDAKINFTNPAGHINYADQPDARIYLLSPKGNSMVVDISAAGQVLVQ